MWKSYEYILYLNASSENNSKQFYIPLNMLETSIFLNSFLFDVIIICEKDGFTISELNLLSLKSKCCYCYILVILGNCEIGCLILTDIYFFGLQMIIF